jgi:hypothetical protein
MMWIAFTTACGRRIPLGSAGNLLPGVLSMKNILYTLAGSWPNCIIWLLHGTSIGTPGNNESWPDKHPRAANKNLA